MKCLVAFGLLAALTSVLCQEERIPTGIIAKSRPVGVIYLIELLNQPPAPISDYDEVSNFIPSDYPYKNSKLLYALSPNGYRQDKTIGREKRSPGYGGKGGGGCSQCGGGGGGGHGGGGYPGGGGGGFGGGHAGSGSWSSSSSQASSGSWGGGGGKGGYHG